MRTKAINMMLSLALLVTISACGSFGFGVSSGGVSIGTNGVSIDGLNSGIFGDMAFDVINYVAVSAAEDLAAGEVAEEFSPEQSYYIGRGVSAALVDRYKAVDPSNPKVKLQLEYLNELAGFLSYNGKMKTALWNGVTVGLLDSNDVAAFSTPGGFVWITRGAIKLCENEDQLAAILAHELGHASMNHALEAYGKAIRPNPWLKNLDMITPMGLNFGKLIGGLADMIDNNGYEKGQEFEADQWGARTLANAGYSADAMVSLLRQVKSYKARTPTPSKYLQNHPDINDRISEVQKLIKDGPEFSYSVSSGSKKNRTARFHATFK